MIATLRSISLASLQPDPYTAPLPGDASSFWAHITGALQQSLYRVLSLLVGILPGLLAFAFALGLLTAVGVGLSWVARRVLTAGKFDERFTRESAAGRPAGGLADWSPGHSPTALAGRVIFWSCVLLGLLIGISALEASYTAGSALPISLTPYLTRAVGAVLLLVTGNLLARFLARSVLIGAVNNQLHYARFLSMGVKWLVLVLTAAMVLDHLQVGGTVVELAFGILFGGIVLTLSLAIGLGSRDLVTRSLERSAERTERGSNVASIQSAAESRETLRHF